MILKLFAYLRGLAIDVYFSNRVNRSYVAMGAVCKSAGELIIGRISMKDGSMIKVVSGKLEVLGPLYLNRYSRIICMGNIKIGSNVLVGESVSILDHNHNFIYREQECLEFNKYVIKPVEIGSNVWIGDKVTILAGVSICSNVVIGANSVVSKSIEEPGVYGGVPSSLIRSLC